MKRWLAPTLVALQFVLLLALVLLPRGGLWPVETLAVIIAALLIVCGALAAVLGVIGLGSALTASPVPRKGGELVTGGIYRLVRHPIYTGLLIGAAGLVVLGASVFHLATAIALLALLSVKSRWEERMLIAAYPDYRDYASRTGRFLPGIGLLH